MSLFVKIIVHMEFALRKKISGTKIAATRKKLKLTQEEFANFCGVSKKTIQRFEKSDEVSGEIVTIIDILNKKGDLLDELVVPSMSNDFPIRLYYYKEDILCTTIDVDEINQRVKIKNYGVVYSDCAFGNNQHPSYLDYLDFLKSRCFPEERDKMKLLLSDLNLPFYDPFMIIEKTKGRMAEDDYWIDIKRI